MQSFLEVPRFSFGMSKVPTYIAPISRIKLSIFSFCDIIIDLRMVLNKKNKNILKCRCSEKFLALAAVRFFTVSYCYLWISSYLRGTLLKRQLLQHCKIDHIRPLPETMVKQTQLYQMLTLSQTNKRQTFPNLWLLVLFY